MQSTKKTKKPTPHFPYINEKQKAYDPMLYPPLTLHTKYIRMLYKCKLKYKEVGLFCEEMTKTTN